VKIDAMENERRSEIKGYYLIEVMVNLRVYTMICPKHKKIRMQKKENGKKNIMQNKNRKKRKAKKKTQKRKSQKQNPKNNPPDVVATLEDETDKLKDKATTMLDEEIIEVAPVYQRISNEWEDVKDE
jgi:hypothetical protein